MSGSELQAIMEVVLPEDVLMEAVEAAGFVQRRRKREALKFLRAMLLSATSPSGGRQANIMRTYFECQGGAPVARGSFYDWFGPALERVLERLAQRVLAYVRQQEPDLPGPLLGCVKDWLIVDSTTVRLDDRLQEDYPGTGDYAALNVHKTLSVGCGTVVDYDSWEERLIRPERPQDIGPGDPRHPQHVVPNQRIFELVLRNRLPSQSGARA